MRPIFILVLVCLFGDLFAQKNIVGTVLDPNDAPLPYATISVLAFPDSTWLTGTSTDENGRFQLNVDANDVWLQLAFLSFETKTIGPISLTNITTELGNIQMSQSNMTLEEVVVQGEKSQVEFKLDKRVFNVGKDLSNIGGNATDILDNIPGITVDVEGGVELRGSGNVRILINGQPSSLTSGDNNALNQLQASMIEKIEVITNPSARYEAEGEVGIINIVLKKNRQKGLNGSVDLNTGIPHNHGIGLNLNYRRNKFNFFTNVGGNFRRGPGGGESTQFFYNESGDVQRGLLSDREHNRGGLSGNFQLGADYYFNPKTSLTVSGLYSYGDEENNTDITYTDLDALEQITAITSREDRENEIDHDAEGRINFTKTFDSDEHKWTVDFNFQLTDDTESSEFTEKDITEIVTLEQRSRNEEDERTFILQSDYVHPFGDDGKFEAGLRASYREVDNTFLVEELNDLNEWTVFQAFNDAMRYSEGIYAGYAIFGNKVRRFGYQLGLRAEYSDILTELTEANTANPRSYLDWFPSAHFSYDINEKNQLQLSYSRRISRPSFRHLLPFSTFSDNRNQRQGNPDLNPEYTNSIEAGILHFLESGSILTSVYYRHRTGLIQRITETFQDSLTVSRPINLGSQDAFGVEIGMNIDLLKWLSATWNINTYYADTKGSYDNQNFDVTTFSANSRLTLKGKFDKNWMVQSSVNYRGPQDVPQGRRLATYSWDIGVSKDVLQRRGTISLSIRDVLNSRYHRSITEDVDFYSENEFQWRVRSVVLGFNYQINRSDKRRGNGSRGNGGQGGNNDLDIDVGG